MRMRWLGWAGVELETAGETLVLDALEDAASVFAPLGEHAAATPLPALASPGAGRAAAALVTHLHRDHADAGAIAAALAGRGPVLEPPGAGGGTQENLALLQADRELAAAGVDRRSVVPWETVSVGPFSITALPAADGLGDPQVSWLVGAGGTRVLHLGDTMFHGYWWRIAQRCGPVDVVLAPVNGAAISFAHRRPPSPLPAVMTPEQAAVAAHALGARAAIPIHADGYATEGVYEPVAGAAAAFAAAAQERGVRVVPPDLGEWRSCNG